MIRLNYNEIIKTNEVMPCPLCGQRVIIGHNTLYDKWVVECPSCQLMCGSWGSKDVMLRVWNGREKKYAKLYSIDTTKQSEQMKGEHE